MLTNGNPENGIMLATNGNPENTIISEIDQPMEN
jgi:hypothetical protein